MIQKLWEKSVVNLGSIPPLYASKLKISSYREIFSALDKKMSFYEHLKEIWLEKMLFRKFTYRFRVRSVF